MTFKWGIVVGGLIVAVIALAAAVVLLSSDNKSSSTTVESRSAAHGEECADTASGGPAKIDLTKSNLDCVDGKAVIDDFQAESKSTATVSGGWGCEQIPFADYPTLIRCRASGGRELSVIGLAPTAHPHMNPPPTTAELEAVEKQEREESSRGAVVFQTPSENIGCRMERTRVACDIIDFDWSPPPVSAACEQPSAWGHTIVFTTSGSTFTCPDNPIVEPGSGTPVLAYGEAAKVGRFACESRKSGLVCEAPETGHGFLLSVQKLKLS